MDIYAQWLSTSSLRRRLRLTLDDRVRPPHHPADNPVVSVQSVALVLWSWRKLERDVGLDVRSYGRSRIAIQVIPKSLRDIHPLRLADEFRGVSAGEAGFTI